ncbi:cytochrome d ubiquinol oxidase subunit II [Mangrovactinospora gilvigrisea]|uniref:Cytochrome d ubiquinol oxidase subunit II n=1 Tax=Mangrovactinospora gilvigrisea TaxID=1428644 RepID=A0A1J7BIL3_9ACTN|nr:cytochrome d ubiquinol oxidase subunit II [Mangrovactinospora gilvigrisea]OIV38478.1 cytochrome d ubiquinol oxidase subunit II [Mangrovactinospora gilvigrisea]
MHLYDWWFVIIAVLWVGYFFLEGFDFGIGILTKLLARDRAEKRVLINTIGPVWDGNEVWLLTAGGATFAAFPEWYATLFSGFYLPLLIILVCLIIRGVAFEYRAKRSGESWQRGWEEAIFWCSLLPAVLWGVAFGNIVRGVKLDRQHEYVGNFLDLLNIYSILGGVVTLLLFTMHGAVFAGLKTDGAIRVRSRRVSLISGSLGAMAALAFLIWTQFDHGTAAGFALLIVAALALIAALGCVHAGREGWAFTLSGTAIAAAVAMLFVSLHPDVMPSTLNPAWSLTVSNASSTHYTLVIMTWAACVMVPIVLAYQAWSYWVFRRRISTRDIPASA